MEERNEFSAHNCRKKARAPLQSHGRNGFVDREQKPNKILILCTPPPSPFHWSPSRLLRRTCTLSALNRPIQNQHVFKQYYIREHTHIQQTRAWYDMRRNTLADGIEPKSITLTQCQYQYQWLSLYHCEKREKWAKLYPRPSFLFPFRLW